MTETLRKLYETLDARARPEDVADLILLLGGFSQKEKALLDKAAEYSFRRMASRYRSWYSSMLQDFRRPKSMEKQAKIAALLVDRLTVPSDADCADPTIMETFIRDAGLRISKVFGSDFKSGRLNREGRVAAGFKMTGRRYSRIFRLLARMEGRLLRLTRELKMREFQQVSKSGLAYRIAWEDFQSDPIGGSFTAYYVATSNRRSAFIAGPQRRAMDAVAKMLVERAEQNSATNWRMIANVYADTEILDRLQDGDKGQLIGQWYDILVDIADMLQVAWNRSNINKKTMVVHRGDDSSTWNVLAGAWNKARSNWISLLYATRMESVLDAVCPGKVLRLMAADVARWHNLKKGGDFEDSLEPDTKVWAAMPLPWEVLRGEVKCGRAEVEAICIKFKVDSTTKGWTGPKHRAGEVEEFVPTPELVHGVMVSSPQLAAVIRKAGWFSGKRESLKPVEEPVLVVRDEHGFALQAVPNPPMDPDEVDRVIMEVDLSEN